jgi:hypothetical protein
MVISQTRKLRLQESQNFLRNRWLERAEVRFESASPPGDAKSPVLHTEVMRMGCEVS